MERSNFYHRIKACLLKWTGFFVLSGFFSGFVSCDSISNHGAAGRIMPNITGGATTERLVTENRRQFVFYFKAQGKTRDYRIKMLSTKGSTSMSVKVLNILFG